MTDELEREYAEATLVICMSCVIGLRQHCALGGCKCSCRFYREIKDSSP